ncbi:MAG TPA: hypothetical protein VNO31_09800 [Umezawaea sp.]|nr:hypothetical protein [Umezawaea sp.]
MTKKSWQQASIEGLAALTVDAMPAVEVLLLDDIADYLMGAGPRQPPYTVEHGSRVVSALFGAVVNARTFTPSQVPAPTPEITAAREQIVRGAHDFAAGGVTGISRLANRVIPATLGELETHQKSPEKQTCLVFYFALLAVASGPRNLLDETSSTKPPRSASCRSSRRGTPCSARASNCPSAVSRHPDETDPDLIRAVSGERERPNSCATIAVRSAVHP